MLRSVFTKATVGEARLQHLDAGAIGGSCLGNDLDRLTGHFFALPSLITDFRFRLRAGRTSTSLHGELVRGQPSILMQAIEVYLPRSRCSQPQPFIL